jgi:hypothetical protein
MKRASPRKANDETDMQTLLMPGALAMPAALLRAPNLSRSLGLALENSAANDNFDDDPPPCASAPVVRPSTNLEEDQADSLERAVAARWARRV